MRGTTLRVPLQRLRSVDGRKTLFTIGDDPRWCTPARGDPAAPRDPPPVRACLAAGALFGERRKNRAAAGVWAIVVSGRARPAAPDRGNGPNRSRRPGDRSPGCGWRSPSARNAGSEPSPGAARIAARPETTPAGQAAASCGATSQARADVLAPRRARRTARCLDEVVPSLAELVLASIERHRDERRVPERALDEHLARPRPLGAGEGPDGAVGARGRTARPRGCKSGTDRDRSRRRWWRRSPDARSPGRGPAQRRGPTPSRRTGRAARSLRRPRRGRGWAGRWARLTFVAG